MPVPELMPDTEPDELPIVSKVAVVLHVPPATPSPSVMAEPAHTEAGPVIAVGVVFTVMVIVAVHPVVATV